MNVSSNDFKAEVQALQERYINALDRKDMEGWLDCFSPNGGYICTTAENHSQNLPIAIMHDMSPECLRDRIKFIEKIWSGTYEDYTTRHFIQQVSWEDVEDGVRINTSFLTSFVDKNGMSGLLATGCYEDEVEFVDGTPLFRKKIAIIDASVTPRYLVYPL